MEMFLQMRPKDQKREERMEERRLREKRDREERQTQLIAQLKKAQPAVPQQVTTSQDKMLKMSDKDDLEIFDCRSDEIAHGSRSHDLHRHDQGS